MPVITDRDWELVTLGGRSDPRGAEGRRVTLRLEAAARRAGGFAGCNRYGGGFRLAGDSLSFEAMVATRMACADGMDLEQQYLSVLPQLRRFEATDSTLTLSGPAGALARFVAAPR